VTVIVPLDPFMSLKALSAYSGLSVRKLRQLIDRDPADALPVYRVDDRVLVRRSEFDEWMRRYRVSGRQWRAIELLDPTLEERLDQLAGYGPPSALRGHRPQMLGDQGADGDDHGVGDTARSPDDRQHRAPSLRT
jgi:hypothetical protein